MNNSAQLIAAVGACALAGMVLAALALPIELPTIPSAVLVAEHYNRTTELPFGSSDPDATDPTFYSEMATMNARMHDGMDIAPGGDGDRDFIQMMIPHHQHAIDMALVQLKYGHDEKLRRLAQQIIVEQGREILYMRSLLDANRRAPRCFPAIASLTIVTIPNGRAAATCWHRHEPTSSRRPA